MRRLGLVAVAALTGGCQLSAEPNPHEHPYAPLDEVYDRDAGAAMIATAVGALPPLPDCNEGDVLVMGPSGWSCDPTFLPRLAALEDAACPAGFRSEAAAFQPCRRVVAGSSDTMVKVGDFWIDQYESSVCVGGSLGGATGAGTTAKGCSTWGYDGQNGVTWFQAAALCANAGKRLCTNAEWQTAASGTLDSSMPLPDTNYLDGCSGPPSGSACITCAGLYNGGGFASGCVSRFGAYDMIGNLAEWVADWDEAGASWQGTAEQPVTPRAGVARGPWPIGYADDDGRGLNGTAYDGVWMSGLPAAMVRGGSFVDGVKAGVFALRMDLGPSAGAFDVGFRCCLGP